MATVPQFPAGTLARSALNNFVTETTTNLTDTNIAAGANISESKLAAGTRARVINRQGGSASDWSSVGTNTQAVSTPKIQCGSYTTNASVQTAGSLSYVQDTITFPTAFSNTPLVFAVMASGAGWCKMTPGSSTTISITCEAPTTVATLANQTVYWIAIGE